MSLRVANFRDDVLYVAASELAIDVQSIDFTKDIARQYVSFANRHVKDAWEYWEWPEIDITEERAFRNIWNATKQFVRNTSSGKPDQLFYIPSLTYYDVLSTAPSDPPVGTVPTNTTYFTPSDMTKFETYIDLDQPCRRAIGRVMGVYHGNPSLNGSAPGVPYKPTEKGIFVRTGGPTVFMRYQILPSQFTSEAYDPALAYDKNDLVYFNDDGNCYRALGSVSAGITPTSSDNWALVPLPTTIAQYVALMTAASAAEDRQAKADLKLEAEDALIREIDKLTEQGQRMPRYKMGNGRRRTFCGPGWFCSIPWVCSSSVTTLTDVCEDAGAVVSVATSPVSEEETGVTSLTQDQDYFDIVFVTEKTSAAWEFSTLDIEYPSDPPPEKIDVTGSIKTTLGARVYLNSGPSITGVKARWRIRL